MVALVFLIAAVAPARAAIFIVCDVFKMRERRHGQLKNEIMNGNQGDHVTFVWSWRRSKQRLSFCRTFHPFCSTPRCRCPAQTYTPEPRCHTSYTGGLIWAVRLWITCHGATMCSKCHAYMPVRKMYNPCKIHLTPQPCGKPPRSGSAVLPDKNDPVCFSILQK